MAQGFSMPEEVYSLMTPGGIDPARVKPIWSDSGLVLPQGGPVTFERSNQLWFLAGSGFRGSAGEAGVILSIDGTPIITSRLFFNTINTHQALVPSWVKTAYGIGSHTVAISATGSLLTDANDRWTVVMFELENAQELLRIDTRPSVVTSLPTNPEHGQEVYYQYDATNKYKWHLKYDSTAPTYKWIVLAGLPLSATNNYRGFTGVTSTSYADVPAMGGQPSVTLPLAGLYEFTLSAHVTSPLASGGETYVSVEGSGQGAADLFALVARMNDAAGPRLGHSASRQFRRAHTAGGVFTKARVTTGTGHVELATLSAMPVAVS